MVSGQGHLQKTFYPIYFLCANTISYQKLGYLCASWWRPDSWRKQHVSLLNEIIRATKVYNHLISMYSRTCVMCTPAMVTERCGRAGCGCRRRQRQQRLIRCASRPLPAHPLAPRGGGVASRRRAAAAGRGGGATAQRVSLARRARAGARLAASARPPLTGLSPPAADLSRLRWRGRGAWIWRGRGGWEGDDRGPLGFLVDGCGFIHDEKTI